MLLGVGAAPTGRAHSPLHAVGFPLMDWKYFCQEDEEADTDKWRWLTIAEQPPQFHASSVDPAAPGRSWQLWEVANAAQIQFPSGYI